MRVGDVTGMTTCDAPTPPDHVEGRDHQECEHGRADYGADHRCGDPLHHIGAGAGVHMMGAPT